MSRREADFISTDKKLQSKIDSDQTLNTLKRLRELETDKEARAEIQAFVMKRIAEIIDEDRKG